MKNVFVMLFALFCLNAFPQENGIKTIFWEINNQPSTVFPYNDTDTTATIHYWIFLESNLAIEDIADVWVETPYGRSSIPIIDNVNSEENYIGINHTVKTKTVFQNSELSHVIFLGRHTISVQLKDGTQYTKEALVTLPGNNGTDNFDYIYTENITENEQRLLEKLHGAPCLKRPSILKCKKSGTDVVLSFRIDDPLFFRGAIMLQDDTNETVLFYWITNYSNIETDTSDGVIVIDSNTLNTITLKLPNEYIAEEITSIIIGIHDGNQFDLNKPENIPTHTIKKNHISWSERYTF